MSSIDRAYEEIVHWVPNLFKVPSGSYGTLFVTSLATLLSAYAEGSALEGVALKAAMCMPALLLQRSHHRSKNAEHIRLLRERIDKWNNGEIDSLLHEGKTIQSHLPPRRKNEDTNTALDFAKLMEAGKLKAAMRMISECSNAGSLSLNGIQPDGRTVKDHLMDKHPARTMPPMSAIVDQGQDSEPHPVLFDEIDGTLIRTIAVQTTGSAGPSGLDASGWRRLCTSFSNASTDLCNAIACLTRRICTEYVDPKGLTPLLASRLIALDKNPGVRPIGVGEVLRRMVAKAALRITSSDILNAAGSFQLCSGHASGCEAGIHAMTEIQSDDQAEAVLLVDVSNAFNSLNREAAMRNVQALCPSLAKIVVNTYRDSTPLFIDGETILSQEGTTQGDPLAMSIYAIATVPLIRKLPNTVNHIWFADDASAGGKLGNLRSWWNKIREVGPLFGYHPNAHKSWLLVEEEFLPLAKEVFSDSEVNISVEGRSYLGAPLGTSSFSDTFIATKVNQWVKEIDRLTEFAQSQPQSAYCALTNGLLSKWKYLMRVIPDLHIKLQPVEDALRFRLLPAITGRRDISDTERQMFALPARDGGLGIPIIGKLAVEQYRASSSITTPLVSLCTGQSNESPLSIQATQEHLKRETKKQHQAKEHQERITLKSSLPPKLQKAVELASEKGASTWLTTLPIKSHGFSLHKQTFRDALCIRYDWDPPRLPSHCSCGAPFSTTHALNCHKGAFPTVRHNHIRDLTAQLLTEVCPNVGIEPHLQPISGETFLHAQNHKC